MNLIIGFRPHLDRKCIFALGNLWHKTKIIDENRNQKYSRT
jgi:hypothetical protein